MDIKTELDKLRDEIKALDMKLDLLYLNLRKGDKPIIFNPENKPVKSLTWREFCSPFMDITTQDEANQYITSIIEQELKENPHKRKPELFEDISRSMMSYANHCNENTTIRVRGYLDDYSIK